MKRICVIGVLSVLLSLLLCASVLASAETFAGFPVVKLMVNGQLKEPTSPVIIIDGRTYVPLRFVSESLGAKVDWDDVTGTVKIITSGLVPQSSPVQPVGQTSPLSATDKGITITIVSVNASPSGTTLKVKVANNSGVDLDFAVSLTQVVAGNTQFDNPTSYDPVFIDDLHPGVTKEGELHFPALPQGTKQIKVYFKSWVGSLMNSFNPVLTVQL